MNEEKKPGETPNFEGEDMKMPENSTSYPPIKQGTSVDMNGILLGVLTVLLLLILGGMYYWFSTLTTTSDIQTETVVERPTLEENNEPESTTAEARTQTLEVISISDELDSIIADIEGTDFDSLDSDINTVENEVGTVLSDI